MFFIIDQTLVSFAAVECLSALSLPTFVALCHLLPTLWLVLATSFYRCTDDTHLSISTSSYGGLT